MALVSLRNISLAFHQHALLDEANLQLEENERVCLIGRNGTGKSTLLGILAGRQDYDAGETILQPGTVIAELAQTVPSGEEGTVADIVAGGLGEQGNQLAEFHQLTVKLANDNDPKIAARIDELQHALDMSDGWNLQSQVDVILSKTQLDGNLKFADLSAGKKRRVLLARALVCNPNVLLLDEPTNHLDIESIIWLEEFLQSFPGTIIFVTHDRAFARKVATRIVDIDRAKLTSWACDYDTYLVRKEAALEAEEKQNALFDKRLAQEEVWIRQGIKARRTRNEGRVRALKKMRDQYQSRRSKVGSVKLEVHDADRSGQMVIKAEEITHAFPDLDIVDNFSTTIMRGEKIGILGPNGIGKTTLLKILLGELEPNEGTVKTGTNVQVAYFDQLHSRLDESQTLRDNIGEGNEHIQINGVSKHVVGYLQEFLFTSEQANRQIKYLSGGEKNRLLLARLFAKPSNMLVLDEPTNDLDSDTMELLEGMLVEYQGTLMVVSHDRQFLDNVVTSTIAFEGEAVVRQYAGGYSDWLSQRKVFDSPAEKVKEKLASQPATEKPSNNKAKPRKLSYKEQRELDGLPELIEKLEEEQADIQSQMADPSFYQKSPEDIKTVTQRLEEIGNQLNYSIERWEELEEVAGG